ncbi:proline-rich receptor-like protein kinase PERK2 [Iris pallida]|nr:proline-rich receptor-like protein kinase PERK2 [Iris pallida]
MSERPPSSHISCHSRQANQSRVRTRVSVYFPSYSTGLQASKPRDTDVTSPCSQIPDHQPASTTDTYLKIQSADPAPPRR